MTEDTADQWQSELMPDEAAVKELYKLHPDDQTPTVKSEYEAWAQYNAIRDTEMRPASDPPGKLFKEGHRKKNKEPLTKAQVLACALEQQAKYATLAANKSAKSANGRPRSLRDWDDKQIIYGREHLQLKANAAQLHCDLIERITGTDPVSKAVAFNEAKSRARSAQGTTGKRDQFMAGAGSEYWGTQRQGYRLPPLSERGGDYLMPMSEHYQHLSKSWGDMAKLISTIAEHPKRIAA
jgi:hypothetical protein